jgi:hypothetical protein
MNRPPATPVLARASRLPGARSAPDDLPARGKLMASTPRSADAAVLALDYGTPVAVRGSRTLRQYTHTLLWTFGAIGLCMLLYAAEKWLVRDQLGWIHDARYRMFKNPSELPMRLFGMPHIVVGTLFLLSSRRMRGARSLLWLGGLALVGIVLCVLFGTLGQDGDRISPIALLLFYFYFLIHGFRDEAFFYKAFGEMPPGAARSHDRIMVVLQVLMLGLLASLALPAYVLYGQMKPEFRHPALEAIFPASWPYATRFAVSFTPMVIIALVVLGRIARQFPDGLRGLWRAHYPILTVFLGSTGIILLALVSGPWTFNAVVLMHFVGWYLFGRYSLAQRPPREPPAAGSWSWMRSTRVGFTWLHLGLAVLAVLLVAVSTYAFGKTGALEAVVGSKAFYYWTIMHVTLSFFPRN